MTQKQKERLDYAFNLMNNHRIKMPKNSQISIKENIKQFAHPKYCPLRWIAESTINIIELWPENQNAIPNSSLSDIKAT